MKWKAPVVRSPFALLSAYAGLKSGKIRCLFSGSICAIMRPVNHVQFILRTTLAATFLQILRAQLSLLLNGAFLLAHAVDLTLCCDDSTIGLYSAPGDPDQGNKRDQQHQDHDRPWQCAVLERTFS